MQKLNLDLSGGLYVINHKPATSPSPNRPRQLHINYTWSEADECKRCIRDSTEWRCIAAIEIEMPLILAEREGLADD